MSDRALSVDGHPKLTRMQGKFSSKIDPHVRTPAWEAKRENRSDYGEHVGQDQADAFPRWHPAKGYF